jgi:hypothetical protein
MLHLINDDGRRMTLEESLRLLLGLSEGSGGGGLTAA